MTGFAADWLSLREPADRRARDPAILQAVAARFARSGRVCVTDLACGTGSSLRALAAHLPAQQTWRLVDHDPLLVAAAARAASNGAYPPGIELETLQADLALELEAVVALDADLLTTSAFLDLVSDDWLSRMVAAAAAHRRPVYAALSYDGRVACSPPDPLDSVVLEAFDIHQRRDKGLGGPAGADRTDGLGGALGPTAAAIAAQRFAARGFSVLTARADWDLTPAESALQDRLLLGWHAAVAETGRVAPDDLDRWLARRRAALAEGRSRLRVGHVDLFAVPPGDALSPARSTSHSRSAPSA